MKEYLKQWIKDLFHCHKWEIIHDEVMNHYGCCDDKMPYKTTRSIICRCSICGKLKQFNYTV